MKTGVAWIIGIAVVLAAFLIGFFIYKASQNIKAAGAAAGGRENEDCANQGDGI